MMEHGPLILLAWSDGVRLANKSHFPLPGPQLGKGWARCRKWMPQSPDPLQRWSEQQREDKAKAAADIRVVQRTARPAHQTLFRIPLEWARLDWAAEPGPITAMPSRHPPLQASKRRRDSRCCTACVRVQCGDG